MKLHVHSDLWRQIFYSICKSYGNRPSSKEDLENVLYTYNVKVHKSFEGRWQEIEIDLNDEELTLFLLKYA